MLNIVILLEGANPQWVATNSPIASYTNIEGGTYKFRVKAKNRDGVWSDEETITIHIKPPYWKTKWFFVLSLLGILLLTYAFYRYRIAQIQKKKPNPTISTSKRSEDTESADESTFYFQCIKFCQKQYSVE